MMGYTGLRAGSQNEKIYTLFFEEGKKIEEIAEIIGADRNIVSSKISKLKSRIERGLIKKNIVDHRIRVQKAMSRDGEYLDVTIEVNDKLKELLNEFAVNGDVSMDFYGMAVQRKLVKSVLVHSVTMDELFYGLFTKEILENNKATFKFKDLSNFTNLMMAVNSNIPNLIRAMTELSRKQTVTVDYSVTSHSQTPVRDDDDPPLDPNDTEGILDEFSGEADRR